MRAALEGLDATVGLREGKPIGILGRLLTECRLGRGPDRSGFDVDWLLTLSSILSSISEPSSRQPMSAFKVSPPSPQCARPSGERSFRSRVQRWRQCLLRDVDAVLEHDPAARHRIEVVMLYPGVHALWAHRVAHALWTRRRFLSARFASHLSRMVTGVEIHPGAQIGRDVFIDHGMGVVIGETAVVGDGCLIFKGVVLGGTTAERRVRHPRLGKNVVVGTNAVLLGAIEVGDGARIGSGSVVIRSVPEDATVVGVPGRVMAAERDRHARFHATLDHASLPDPVHEILRSLMAQNERLRERLSRLEDKLDLAHEDGDDEHHLIDSELATQDLPTQVGG